MDKLKFIKKLQDKKAELKRDAPKDRLCRKHPELAKAIINFTGEVLDWVIDTVLEEEGENS